VPVRGICCRITTPKAHPPLLSNSYILRVAPGEYDYLIPRADGSIVVGGAKRDFYKQLDQWYDVVDDSKLIEPAKNYFDGYMQRHFHGWEDVSRTSMLHDLLTNNFRRAVPRLIWFGVAVRCRLDLIPKIAKLTRSSYGVLKRWHASRW
jgi:glycine/D-amino acid oxidase-like deaminating enzyme